MSEFVPYYSYNTGMINAAGLALFRKSPKLYTLVILLRAGSILQGEIRARVDALPAAVRDSIPGWYSDWIAMVNRWDSYVALSGNIIESGDFDPLADVVPGTIPYEFIVKPLLLGQLPDLKSAPANEWKELAGRVEDWLPWNVQPAWKRFGPGADFGAVFGLINQINALGIEEDGWVSVGWYERMGQLMHQGMSAGAEVLADGYGALADEWAAASKSAADTFSGMVDSVGREIKKAAAGAGGILVLAVVGLGLLMLATRGKK